MRDPGVGGKPKEDIKIYMARIYLVQNKGTTCVFQDNGHAYRVVDLAH